MAEQQNIKLPTGRLIYGHPMKLTPKVDFRTGIPVLDLKTGLSKQECYFQP